MEQVALTLGITIDKQAYQRNLTKTINQVYKLLPMREENKDWKKLLETLIVEIAGMKQLIDGQDELFFIILCKMKGLMTLNKEEDMPLYRRNIFDLLSLLKMLKDNAIITIT